MSDEGHVLSVNVAVPMRNDIKAVGFTGIDKRPTDASVMVRAPGPRGQGPGSGLEGDQVFDSVHHQGDHRAVCVYAREDLDLWEAELGRPLPSGAFGENLTTAGIDVTGVLLGERWRVGEVLVLEVTQPRNPCVTFHNWMGGRGWLKRFTTRAVSGCFLRVVEPGEVRAGDVISVVSRPSHDVTVGLAFRALTRQRELQMRLVAVDNLTDDIADEAVSSWSARLPGLHQMLEECRSTPRTDVARNDDQEQATDVP
ncbi:MAG: MOSC domain-containing protein [Acidimicrobiales bacterium]